MKDNPGENPDRTGEIIVVLDELAEGYARKDLAGILACYSATPRAYGSGPDEVAESRSDLESAIRRDLAQAGKISVTFSGCQVSVRGDVAWMMGICQFRVVVNRSLQVLDGRMSAVFVREGGKWLIAQSHFAMPSGDQGTGESYPGSA